jgi:hypothetical protein
MLEILACLYEWLADEYEYGDKRLGRRDEVSKGRCTTINSALELKSPMSLSAYDDDSDEDDDSESDGD